MKLTVHLKKSLKNLKGYQSKDDNYIQDNLKLLNDEETVSTNTYFHQNTGRMKMNSTLNFCETYFKNKKKEINTNLDEITHNRKDDKRFKKLKTNCFRRPCKKLTVTFNEKSNDIFSICEDIDNEKNYNNNTNCENFEDSYFGNNPNFNKLQNVSVQNPKNMIRNFKKNKTININENNVKNLKSLFLKQKLIESDVLHDLFNNKHNISNNNSIMNTNINVSNLNFDFSSDKTETNNNYDLINKYNKISFNDIKGISNNSLHSNTELIHSNVNSNIHSNLNLNIFLSGKSIMNKKASIKSNSNLNNIEQNSTFCNNKKLSKKLKLSDNSSSQSISSFQENINDSDSESNNNHHNNKNISNNTLKSCIKNSFKNQKNQLIHRILNTDIINKPNNNKTTTNNVSPNKRRGSILKKIIKEEEEKNKINLSETNRSKVKFEINNKHENNFSSSPKKNNTVNKNLQRRDTNIFFKILSESTREEKNRKNSSKFSKRIKNKQNLFIRNQLRILSTEEKKRVERKIPKLKDARQLNNYLIRDFVFNRKNPCYKDILQNDERISNEINKKREDQRKKNALKDFNGDVDYECDDTNENSNEIVRLSSVQKAQLYYNAIREGKKYHKQLLKQRFDTMEKELHEINKTHYHDISHRYNYMCSENLNRVVKFLNIVKLKNKKFNNEDITFLKKDNDLGQQFENMKILKYSSNPKFVKSTFCPQTIKKFNSINGNYFGFS